MCFLSHYDKTFESKLAALQATSRGQTSAKPDPDPAFLYSPTIEIPPWVFERSDSVRVYVNISFTIVRCTKPSCNGDFFTMFRQSDADANLIGFDEAGPITTNKLISDVTGGFDPNDYITEEQRSFVVNSSDSQPFPYRFSVVIKEQGACVGLVRLKVFYHTCPSFQSGLLHFPRTVPSARSASGFYGSKVQGICSENSQYTNEALVNLPSLICNPSGSWIDYSRRLMKHGPMIDDEFCQCSPGSELIINSSSGVNLLKCQGCPSNHFKSEPGSLPCSSCPKNSMVTSYGATFCPCLPSFARAQGDSMHSACTRPPSSPQNLLAKAVNQTAVILSWKEPSYTGERPDELVKYRVECSGCSSLVHFTNYSHRFVFLFHFISINSTIPFPFFFL